MCRGRWMAGAGQSFGLEHFGEAIGQAGSAENFAKKQNRAAGIGDLRDGAKGTGKFGIGGELVGTGVEPRINRRVAGAQFGLQFAGIAWRIIDQESRIDPEETGQQIARGVGHVRTRSAFNLRKVSLAQAAS